MSIRTLQQNSLDKKRFFNLPIKTIPSNTYSQSSWYRNPSWSVLPSMTTSDSKFIGLVAIYPDGGEPAGFISLKCAGNYTVDWGDGVTENFNSGVSAHHVYDYNDSDLANTNAPVTLTDSGDIITRNNHGYINDMPVQFYNIASTTGITEGQTYYVVNANTNTFQISSTIGGSAITLTNDGSANLLIYKQAIVTVTPQAGSNLTSIDLNVRHTQLSAKYCTAWLDIKLGSPNLTSLTFYPDDVLVTALVWHNRLEQIEILNCGSITSFAYLFYYLQNLKNVIFASGVTTNITNMSNMFSQCYSLNSVPLFDTQNVTNMSYMFSACMTLNTVPLFNTQNVTNMQGMLDICYDLESVPLFNTQNVTSMNSMFNACYNLESIPFFNTKNVTDMAGMFNACFRLITIPLFNTSNVTSMAGMFSQCYNLQKIPLLDTGKVTSMASMFQYCYSLISVPSFNTENVTNMNSTFGQCYSLSSVPLFNTKNVTNMINMFLDCTSLFSVPLFNTEKVTTMNSMFSGCKNIKTIPLFNTISVTNMQSMFNLCHSLISIPLFNTQNVTTMYQMFSGCGSITTVPLFNTQNVTSMQFMFSGCTNLAYVPLFNTQNVTTMNQMFVNCYNLNYVPLFNTANVTNMQGMFSNCWNLVFIPLFNTINVTTMNNMFSYCTNIITVPLFDTQNVTDMTSMFEGCSSLEYVPLFNTIKVTLMNTMFQFCYVLKEVPLFNMQAVTNNSNMLDACWNINYIPALNLSAINLAVSFSTFNYMKSLQYIDAYGHRYTHILTFARLSKTILKKYMDNLGTAFAGATRTLTISGNWGSDSAKVKTVGTTAQSTTVTCTDTSNLTTGMSMIGTRTGITSGISVSSNVTSDTLTLNNHGLIDGTQVSFSALGTTTGVSINTRYYVVGATANTFQISLTVGGAAINLTGTNATMTLRYASYIVSINPNVSITLDVPAVSTGTGNSWTFRSLDPYGALLRGWSITY